LKTYLVPGPFVLAAGEKGSSIHEELHSSIILLLMCRNLEVEIFESQLIFTAFFCQTYAATQLIEKNMGKRSGNSIPRNVWTTIKQWKIKDPICNPTGMGSL